MTAAPCPKCGFDGSIPVLAEYTMQIERDPPSLNARLHNAGNQRWRYAAERDVWSQLALVERVNRRIPHAVSKRRVTLTRIYGGQQKERDVDNLSGGMKICVDALVYAQVLKDDSPAFAELHYKQQRNTDGRWRGLVVHIEVLA